MGRRVNAPDRHARYLANPRECVDCGGVPAAGMPRCGDCHRRLIEDRNEGRAV